MMINLPPKDEHARRQALDTCQSFIVQAPAGSGKTELLIQRLLALLGQAVKEPEEIIAITFTRKAAAEMRHRVLQALQMALTKPEPDPNTHGHKTWTLAQQVLGQNEKFQWHLLENPNRLRIQTIDSLCHFLTGHMPIVTRFGAKPQVKNDMQQGYAKASQALLKTLENNSYWTQALSTLLLHLDNDMGKAERLFQAMLACRDQWLPHLLGHNPREVLEKALLNLAKEQLIKTYHLFSELDTQEFVQLLSMAAENIEAIDPDSPLAQCKNIEALPEGTPENLWMWQTIADWLLTRGENNWRKNFTKKQGILSQSSLKTRMLIFMEKLTDFNALKDALVNVLQLPPTKYNNAQWSIIESALTLLPLLVAQLQLVFKEHHGVDHTEISLKALEALGTHDNPTDLTLALDYQIKHLLLDEFQDTSITQFRILETLTAGWTGHDNRTLFLVGDPMQSIYRFRKAEVGLFLQVRARGIGNVPLKFLQLEVNFRSQQEIVYWNNKIFQDIFPKANDITTGAIAYAPSVPWHYKELEPNAKVSLHPLLDTTSQIEAEKVCQIILNYKKETSDKSIAILVRARSHLFYILPALRHAEIPYRAVELEILLHKPVIQDLCALTRAMLNLSDDIAWYALLRAPWCGLTLEDLLILKNNTTLTLFQTLENYDALPLGSASKIRIERCYRVIHKFMQQKYRQDLSSWLETLWLELGGPACYTDENSILAAKTFFEALSQLEVGGDLEDFTQLETMLSQLTATDAPTNTSDNPIEVMTIHKSKGLEFDCVIIPGLERQKAHDDHQLLAWQERPNDEGGNDLVIAPIKATNSKDKIYEYLQNQEKIKAYQESCRLLYVAATRAKHQLHIIAKLTSNNDPTEPFKLPPAGSFLALIWEQILPDFTKETQNTPIKTSEYNPWHLTRLSLEFENPIQKQELNPIKISIPNSSHILWSSPQEKIVGIVMHQLLQFLETLENREHWNSRSNKQKCQHIHYLLRQAAYNPAALDAAVLKIYQGVENTLQDDIGRWILEQSGKSEYQLSSQKENRVHHFIIDRTFKENGIRWIIDYKTTTQNTQKNLSLFLQQEKKHHHAQLHKYGELFYALDKDPVKLALYFPLIPAWIHWDFSP